VVAAGPGPLDRGPRHVPAPGAAPRGRGVRAGAHDGVGDGGQDGRDPGTAGAAAVRAWPVVPVPRGRHQRERNPGLFRAVPTVFHRARSA